MITATSTREQAQPFWTSDYWLRHCEGYRVGTSESHLGFVEEVIWDAEDEEPTALSVRTGFDGPGLLVVPIAQVREVRAEGEEIVVFDTLAV